MQYKPNPIDTSDIFLESEIQELIEKLAINIHEKWSQQRVLDGWIFGTKRDDEKKQHPCLIEYQDLPESEKLYDRNSAIETIKVILKLGFSIKKQ